MRPSMPTTYVSAGLGPFQRQTGPSSPPITPTSPTSTTQPLSPTASPLTNQQRRNFSRPLAPRGTQNRYEPLTWKDIGRAEEGGGYIQPLGPGTNQFSYIPASRGSPDDLSLSPRSSSPEPSDDDDDDASSVSPRSMTDDEDLLTKDSFSSSGFQSQRSVKRIQDEFTDEDEDMDLDEEKKKIYDRGRRRRSTLKPAASFIVEEMPSRSQERNPLNRSLVIIHPDQYSDAETAPSRDRSLDTNPPSRVIINPVFVRQSIPPTPIPQNFDDDDANNSNNNVIETDTTDTDIIVTNLDPKIMESMSSLTCDADADREAWLRRKRQEKRQKRWSLGSQKRSITQSIGSATDEEDLHGDAMSVVGGGGDEGGVGVGVSARRLRRRTMTSGGDGNGNGGRPILKRVSLLFDDPPKRIVEEVEPESDFGGASGGGRRRVEVEWVDDYDDGLPYFVVGGDVDMDT